MSLVSTYVRADDGKLYRDPTLSGDDWFICFDDDDPVEIVMMYSVEYPNKRVLRKKALEKLGELGIKHTALVDNYPSMRIFNDGDFHDAYAWFFDIKNRIPAKAITRHDGVVDRDSIFQGVIYDPKE